MNFEQWAVTCVKGGKMQQMSYVIRITVTQFHIPNFKSLSERLAEKSPENKASVTIMADFSPEFNPPVRWRSKHQTKNDC